ncbi:Zn(II)2Cys6 transcription factor [Aspergillus ibericus CBS 121593]|uniref:Zn(2)-C6 fungal-type domain-containing protein n=1 Tax=Aspergillus ibericus CBS 121593 TaxID=1448316 RepID=A0A395HAI7_9EURO|nr:hypothetical protein BO80DRAFT_350666 [Aspergillus ibericus CBS 121593]RAL03214.1 hypothetical protein BO80DRAFT_350666 [Aspergillus ibericus CBS 121593]
MKVAISHRAPQVCSPCKLRKKRCDKTVPKCGYCTKRNLRCRYGEFSQAKDELERAAATEISVNAVLMQMTSLFGPSQDLSAVPERIWYQVHGIIKFADLSLQEIGRRYFSNFHKWLPIMLPQLYCQETAGYLGMPGSPATDFSILMLAMCLVTLQPSNSQTKITPQGLYGTVKMLFAETQAIMCASDRLLQAGLLIAAYEYANGRPAAAHITMGALTRIAFALGLHNVDLKVAGPKVNQFGTDKLGRCNLWWGVVILERLIICEIKDKAQRPWTEYPPSGFPLPSDLDPDENSPAPLDSVRTVRITRMSNFGRQAQAVFLLDKVLSVRRLPWSDGFKVVELRRLDENLQGFLSMLMSTDKVRIGHDCSPIASAVRALSLIHEEILDHPPDTVDIQWLHYSQSALGMVTNVVVDVARHHKEQIACQNAHVDLLPLSCSYTLHLAMKHIRNCVQLSCPHRRSSDLDSLAQLDQIFSDRWKPKEC